MLTKTEAYQDVKGMQIGPENKLTFLRDTPNNKCTEKRKDFEISKKDQLFIQKPTHQNHSQYFNGYHKSQ